MIVNYMNNSIYFNYVARATPLTESGLRVALQDGKLVISPWT